MLIELYIFVFIIYLYSEIENTRMENQTEIIYL